MGEMSLGERRQAGSRRWLLDWTGPVALPPESCGDSENEASRRAFVCVIPKAGNFLGLEFRLLPSYPLVSITSCESLSQRWNEIRRIPSCTQDGF